ncbi:LacI family transcriptional regulator [Flavobacteriaceae bacterium]|nr:LacI family transcriptional regulator [Flavobacteriaceae bacterium]
MITLKQLAKELNVSVSTVSKALNNSDEISSETIIKVQNLAKELNYKRNKIALSLKSNKTLTLGVILPDILNRFYAKVLYGIQIAAEEFGYDIITFFSRESMSKEIDYLKIIGSGTVDGVLLALSEETLNKNEFSHIKDLTLNDIPLVMLDRITDKISCDKVIIDDFDAIYNEVKSLVKKGRKKIGFITAINNLNVGKYRSNGYRKASVDFFGKCDNKLILKLVHQTNISHIENSEYYRKTAHNYIEQFIKTNPGLDAIIAADNISGILAVNIASKLNIDIPKDLSIVGFGDKLTSMLSYPQLTTINQHAVRIGKRSVELLINRIKSKSTDSSFVTEIIQTTTVGGSSK